MFALLMKFPVEIKTFVFQMKTPSYTVDYLTDIFYENVYTELFNLVY